MALEYYKLQLTSTSANAGPSYSVFYSSDCTNYTFAGRVVLETTESIEYLQMENTSTCIKLQSSGECENFVVSGSSPSTSSYNTQRITLTNKNGAGPEFTVFENTGSLFTYVTQVELLGQGSTATFEAGTPLNAVRLRSSGVCTNQVDVQIEVIPTPTPTPTPSPTPAPDPIYSYKSTKTATNVSVTYIDPYYVERTFAHNSSLPRYFAGRSIVSNTNSTIISSSGVTPHTVYDSSSIEPLNVDSTVSANGCTYLYYLSGSDYEPQIKGPFSGATCGPSFTDCMLSGSLMGPTTWVTITDTVNSTCGTPPPTPPPTAAPGQLFSYKQTNTGGTNALQTVSYTDPFGNVRNFSSTQGGSRWFVGRNIISSSNAAFISQSNATPGNIIDSSGLTLDWSYETEAQLNTNWDANTIYASYVDHQGAELIGEIYRDNQRGGTSVYVDDCIASHSLMLPNFTEVTSRIGNINYGAYCGVPGATPTPTPSPTPTPTPSPNCYTFYTIYSSTNSATDACCNQFQTKPVYLNATSLATATTVYDNPNCSTLRTTPTYYTQNLNDYYYWTGASLVGPTSCPACP